MTNAFSNSSSDIIGFTALDKAFGTSGKMLGELGTAFNDGMDAVFYNPAATAFENDAFRYGYGANSYGPKFRGSGFNDMWKAGFVNYLQVTYKSGKIIGLGLFYNIEHFGKTAYSDLHEGTTVYQRVFGINGSINLARKKKYEMGIGINLKGAKSVLNKRIDGDEAKAFALDLGYLYKSSFGFRFGINIQNMGIHMYFSSKDNPDPIPFAIRLGLGYDREFTKDDVRFIKIKLGYDIDRPFVKSYLDKEPDYFWEALATSITDDDLSDEMKMFKHHIGLKTTFYNTGSFSFGLLLNNEYESREFNFGFGINLLDRVEFNWGMVVCPDTYPFKNGDWSFDVVVKKAANWKKTDLKWYMVDDKKK